MPFDDGPLLGSPTFVTSWPDNSDILVVAERSKGIVTAWGPDGSGPTTVLDLSAEAYLPVASGDFVGVTGIAFHPHFNRNPARRFIYVRFNAAMSGSTIETRIKRYEIAPGSLIAQVSTATTMYTWPTQATGHGSGTIHFDSRPGLNPVLYVPMPDDTTPGDCFLAERVQDTQGPSDLGKLLSIDVNVMPTVVTKLATGLRNPFGFSVDRGQTGTFAGRGDLWIGDVGGMITGSILRWQPGGNFKNYGWPWYEGNPQLTWIQQPQVRVTPNCGLPTNPPGSQNHLPPSAVEVPHATFSDSDEFNGGHDALLGGYVYRSSTISSLTDRYLFATHGTAQTPRLYSLPIASTSTSDPLNHTAAIGMGSWSSDHVIYGLGQDADGEIYILRIDDTAPITANGEIFKVTP